MTAVEGPRRVAVIGVGRMGLPMAEHLEHAGYEAVAWDVSDAAIEAAAAKGVGVCDDIAAMPQRSDGALVVVGTEEQALDVCLGDEGLIPNAPHGYTVIMCSTISVEGVTRIADVAARRGVAVLDAPLCRGEQNARQGTLLALCGGTVDVYERWRPVLQSFCSDVVRLADVGSGQTAKMLNNALLWATICADYEVMRLGMGMGLEQTSLREALMLSSGANWALDTWGRERSMPWAAKDMRLLLASAGALDVEVPLAEVVSEQIERIKAEKERVVQGAPTSMEEFLDRLEDAVVREPRR